MSREDRQRYVKMLVECQGRLREFASVADVVLGHKAINDMEYIQNQVGEFVGLYPSNWFYTHDLDEILKAVK